MIKFPLLATTNASKFAFIKRAIELLRIEHNIIGKWYREGITLIEYQKLRAGVQIAFPYTTEKLSKTEWLRYQKERFDVKMKRLFEADGILKDLLYKSTRFSPNLDDDVI